MRRRITFVVAAILLIMAVAFLRREQSDSDIAALHIPHYTAMEEEVEAGIFEGFEHDLCAEQNDDTALSASQYRQIRQEYYEFQLEYENNDIIGRLIIEGANIDYLVTQAADNEFYLYHDIEKQPNEAGWVFLDYLNNIRRPDRNTIIYGHNMRDDIRFHGLRHFADPEFFRANPYIIFNTAYEDKVWEVFAFYSTNISFNYIQVIFPSDEDFYSLISEMQEKSWHESDVSLSKYDRILTLSTCTNTDPDMRYVLNARLIS